MKKKILVVDDEIHIVELLGLNLKKQGYQPLCAYSGLEALKIAEAHLPDLILLDVMMPEMDGLETCRRLKQNRLLRHIPVIMVSAKTEETDTVIGLGMGADDYIAKPFGLRELFARIGVALRRCEDQPEDGILSAGSFRIDINAHLVECDGSRVNLTLTEYSILKMLVEHAGHVVTREQLIHSSQINAATEPGAVNVHILNLRRKIGEGYIETVRGVGYRLPE
ncbi:response regulator transcription factor [Oscillospiraceae bacterium MB08-C2-2]|nr:response regulator transcription factor [Oscillospiraceae bacterium MB08-C2-2]